MLYRRNLRVALDRLRGLEQELEELLPIYGKEGLGFYGDSKTIDQFQVFCGKLDAMISNAATQLIHYTAEGDEFADARMAQARLTLEHAHSETLRCLLCHEQSWSKNDILRSFNHVNEKSAPWEGTPHLLVVELVATSLRTCKKHRTYSDEPLRIALWRCLNLSHTAPSELRLLLKSLGLFNLFPDIMRPYPYFISDEIILRATEVSLFLIPGMVEDEADCLGRTHLHQMLDLRPSTRSSRATLEARLEEFQMKISRAPQGLHVDKRDILGRTALHIACQRGYTSIAKVLLDKGANPMARTLCELTPLHLAAASGSLEICQTLSSLSEVDFEAWDDVQSTPLDYAIANNHFSVAEKIHSTIGSNPATYRQFLPLLFSAIRVGNSSFVQHLLDTGTDANTDIVGYSAFLWAIRYRDSEVAKLLINRGADVNAKTCLTRQTALHILALYNRHRETEYLIKNTSVDLYALDNRGHTPLMDAASHGCLRVLDTFLRHCPVEYLEWRNGWGLSAVDSARAHSHWDCARRLEEGISELKAQKAGISSSNVSGEGTI